jgi:hypothetical protein
MPEDIKQKIIMQLGASGSTAASKAIAGVTKNTMAMAAAFAGATVGINKLYNSAVELDKLLQSLDTDMSDLNKRTGGLIDTSDSFRGAIAMQEAGLRLTAEQMGAIGVAAADMNKRLGGGPEGATTQYNKLVKAIIQGRETGLVPFGIELSQTADKSMAASEAIQALTNKYAGVSAKAETAKEKSFAFNNSLGTVAASEFNGMLDRMNDVMFDAGGILDGLTEKMSDYEADIVATEGAISKWRFTLDGWSNRTAGWVAWVTRDTEMMQGLNAEYRNQVDLLSQMAQVRGQIEQLGRVQAAEQSFLSAESPGARIAAAENYQRALRAADPSQLSEGQLMARAGLGESISRGKASLSGRGGFGGGGRGSSTKPLGDTDIGFDFTGDAAMRRAESVEAKLQAERGTGFQPLDISELGGLSVRALEQEALIAENDLLMRVANNKREIAEEEKRLQENVTEHQKRELEKREQAQNAYFDSTAGMLSNAAKAFDKSSEAGFKASQAAAYGANVVNTIAGAQGAYNKTMETVPPPLNFPLAILSAGAVAAAGARAGAEIRKQKYKSSAVPRTSTGGTGSFPGGGSFQGGKTDGTTINLSVLVDGNRIQRSMIKANDMAAQSGDRSFVVASN